MTAANFGACLKFVLQEEGGNDDDPNDHGGRTSRGITQSEYDSWSKLKGKTSGDVWLAPQSDIDEIYKEQYWNPNCDSLPTGIDLEFFDFSVNAGRTQAVRCLQKALGVSVDGMLGVDTLNAIHSVDPSALIKAFGQRRIAFYQSLKQFSIYGKGWLSRANRCINAALAMAPTPGTVAQPLPEQVSSPKADAEEVLQPTVSAGAATTGSGTAIIVSGVTDQLQSLATTIQPLSDTIHVVKYASLAIAVICAGLALYALYHNNKMAAAK